MACTWLMSLPATSTPVEPVMTGLRRLSARTSAGTAGQRSETVTLSTGGELAQPIKLRLTKLAAAAISFKEFIELSL